MAENTKPGNGKLTIDTSKDRIKGDVSLNESVVATIAGLAAKDVKGIHALGRSRWFYIGDNPKRGVGAEVGQKQAALDLEVVIDYGHNIKEVARSVRQRIAQQVEQMAGREVVEVNIDVIDIKLPEEEQPEPSRRVQ